MPGLAGGVFSGDLRVEEASANVRVLGLESIGDDSLLVLLGHLFNRRCRGLGGDLGSDGDQPPVSLLRCELCSAPVERGD